MKSNNYKTFLGGFDNVILSVINVQLDTVVIDIKRNSLLPKKSIINEVLEKVKNSTLSDNKRILQNF